MTYPIRSYHVRLSDTIQPPDAYEILKRLAEDDELRERIGKDPRRAFLELGVELGADPVPATVVLPAKEEIQKVLVQLEQAQQVQFMFDPFGAYYPGQRPFIVFLLLAVVAGL